MLTPRLHIYFLSIWCDTLIYVYIYYIYFASSHIGAGRSKLRLHDLPLNMIYKHVLHNPHPGFLVVSNWDKQPNMESKIYSQMLTC